MTGNDAPRAVIQKTQASHNGKMNNPVSGSDGRAVTYSLIVLLVSVALFALPWPSLSLAVRIYKAATAPASVAILGTSVIDYVSPCDSDTRNLTTMLADFTSRSIIDLSEGGQSLALSVNLGALAGRSSGVKDIILPITYAGSEDSATLPFRNLILFKFLNWPFSEIEDDNIGAMWSGLVGNTPRSNQAFTYENVAYPNYDGISAQWFAMEKRKASCPEQVTHDHKFLEAYVWWTHVVVRPNADLVHLIANLNRYLTIRNNTLHVVILPINYELIESLNSKWPSIIRRSQKMQLDELEKLGIDMIDLSEALHANEFSTQWCACTHFNQLGRAKIAAAIAEHLRRTENSRLSTLRQTVIRNGRSIGYGLLNASTVGASEAKTESK